jgi:hypothetical protein
LHYDARRSGKNAGDSIEECRPYAELGRPKLQVSPDLNRQGTK